MLALVFVLQDCSHSLSTALCLWPVHLQDVEPVYRPQDTLCRRRLQVQTHRRCLVQLAVGPQQVLHTCHIDLLKMQHLQQLFVIYILKLLKHSSLVWVSKIKKNHKVHF